MGAHRGPYGVPDPALRSVDDIAEHLGAPREEVRNAIDLLLKGGLIESKGGRFQPTARRIHLARPSKELMVHHGNWRLEAAREVRRNRPEGTHYSSIMSISAKAAEEIRKEILAMIGRCEPVIAEAKDEGVHAFLVDFFEIGGNRRAPRER